jgi:hypothetical protein
MNAHEIPSPPDAERPAGEARSRRRRQIFVAIFAFSLLLGLAVGVGMGMAEGGDLTLTRETSWGLAAAAALLIAGFSVWFYRWVDEVEVQDNLWANTVGLHAGLAAGVPWAFLAHLGHAPDLDLSVLFLIIVGSAALYYTAVKLWRLF